MDAADPEFERLRDALSQFVADDAGQVLAEARAEARSRVKATLTETLARSLHEAIERQLEVGESRPAADPEPSPVADPTPRRSAASDPPASTAFEPAPPADRGQPTGERSTSAGPKGTYVYGVVWATDAPFTEGLSGLDDHDLVGTVVEGPLAAVISRVPLAEFEEDELRGHLSDIEWVERVARAHEAVLDDLCARTVVVPMRMCTVYRSDDNLRSMLGREEVNLRSALEFLEGKIEWGVKVVAQGDQEGRPPDAAAAADDARAASSGADYMARRRARRDEQAETESLQAEAAAEIHESLGALAHDGLLNPIQASELPGQAGRIVMNGVYLVERENAEAFHREVRELEERFARLGLELLESGPWPPYNFVPGDVGAAW